MIKYRLPLILLVIFETVAVTLWLSKNNLFYLFNFSYIGISISLGVFLFIKEILLFQAHSTAACRGVYAGLSGTHLSGNICRSKAFWYYLFTGVFEAATIHYAVAKIFGPLIFGRGWCG